MEILKRIGGWVNRWKWFLTIGMLLLSIIGQVGFSLFIYEEGGQQLVFSSWFFEDAKDWRGMEKAASYLDEVNRSANLFAKIIGWINPIAYPSYRAYFGTCSPTVAEAIHKAAAYQMGQVAEVDADKLDGEYDHLDNDQLPYFEAKDHVGEEWTVVFLVKKAEASSSGKAFFLDSPGDFTAVCFVRQLFPYLEELEGERIGVRGEIKLYRGKPEIVIEDLDQIESEKLSHLIQQLDAEERAERGT